VRYRLPLIRVEPAKEALGRLNARVRRGHVGCRTLILPRYRSGQADFTTNKKTPSP
jgi:hypothetical protein